jgi:cytochrome oxidase Cu insertion factor (SCO1/SenC/PrrC family)
MKLNARKTLLLLVAVFVLPVVASYFTYYVVRPQTRMNYGELLATQPLPPLELQDAAGNVFTVGQLKGRWIMIHVAPGACDTRCRDLLLLMRQVRTAQGKDMDRIERLWIVDDARAPEPEMLRDYGPMRVALAREPAALSVFPAEGDRHRHVYLVDPLGNLMLRFPVDPDPKRMIQDLERLLKYSRIG